MTFKLTFTPDENYYKEAYHELLTLTKVKKWEPLLATLMTIFGIGLFYFDKNSTLSIIPFFFIVMGIYELFKFYYDRNKWLKDRSDSKIKGQIIEMEFNDEIIKHSGPFSTGEIKWTGFKKIIKTKKGIILKPENGISIYLPDNVFNNHTEIDFIMNKK